MTERDLMFAAAIFITGTTLVIWVVSLVRSWSRGKKDDQDDHAGHED